MLFNYFKKILLKRFINPFEAYRYAYNNHSEPGFDLKYYQDIACKNSDAAYCFACDIPGADIEYCQTIACDSPENAYYFASHVPGANIKYCQDIACKDMLYAYLFGLYVPGADIVHCRNACGYLQSNFDKIIIERVML